MRFSVAFVLAFLVAGTAQATNGGQYNSHNRTYDNSTTATGGTAVGIGGASSSKSSATGVGIGGQGGSARVVNRNGQDQGQYQGNIGVNGQSLSGVGTGNSTVVQLGDVKTDAPAVAPSVTPGNPTAPCIVTYGGSVGIPQLALGASMYKRDSVCTWGEVARAARESGANAMAGKALVLMFEEAEAQTGTIARLEAEQAGGTDAASDTGFEGLDALY